jgi:hypothetical protein
LNVICGPRAVVSADVVKVNETSVPTVVGNFAKVAVALLMSVTLKFDVVMILLDDRKHNKPAVVCELHFKSAAVREGFPGWAMLEVW